MIKKAYFRGLMKVAAEPQSQVQDWFQTHAPSRQLKSWDRQWDRLKQQPQYKTPDGQWRSAQQPQQPTQQQPAQQPQQPAQKPVPQKQMSQAQKDNMLVGDTKMAVYSLKAHGFYKDTPTASSGFPDSHYSPSFFRVNQAIDSALKFAGTWRDPVHRKLRDYYESIGRQNRDFYLKNGYRPPADYQYKTKFPYQNHPKKKQMMRQNQYQVNNNRGQQYNGYA